MNSKQKGRRRKTSVPMAIASCNMCMPALFLIHERKFQQHHEIFFNFLREKVKLSKRPIACVNGETGIINAMSVIPNLIDVRCWNHILQDC